MMRSLSAADWNNPNVRFGSLADISERAQRMSALPPKADMFSVKIDVGFVPIADIGTSVRRALFGTAR